MRIVAGTAKSRRIEAPEGNNTRPTLDRVRENLFNILQTRIADSVVLDLFAGSGALSFEAISRGAARAVLCDSDRNANRIECRNAEMLGFSDRVELFFCDWKSAIKFLKQRNDKFDLVFLDPPYRMTDLRDVSDQLKTLLADNALVVVEHEAKQSILFCMEYEKADERRWGYCGVSFYRIAESIPAKKEESE